MTRLLLALLRLAPRRFRNRFGEAFAADVEAMRDAARQRGGPAGEARYLARELGSLLRLLVEARRHAPRSSHARASLRGLAQDLNWAARYVRRRPLFTGLVAGTLGLAIAAATTAFALSSAILWHPLPFAASERLVFLWERQGTGETPGRVTSARFDDWRARTSSFESIAMFGAAAFSLEDGGGARAVRGVRVSANYFDTLGIAPMLGRTFTPRDEEPGRRVAILSHAMWQQQFGARTDAIGAVVRLNREPYTVIGVMPPVLFPAWPVNPGDVTLDPESRQLWVPIWRTPDFALNTRAHVFGTVARLRNGIPRNQAERELQALDVRAAADSHGAQLRPFREQLVQPATQPVLLLLATALAVLLVACANIAALHVAAFEARRTEFATRAALGAGVGGLARQLVAESVTVAGLGGMLGLAASRAALGWIPGQLPSSTPFVTPPHLDLAVALFAVALSMFAGTALAAWPIARLLTRGPAPRGAQAPARASTYRALVVGQIALTAALVVLASLLAQSLSSIRTRNPGFDVQGVLVADFALEGELAQRAEGVVAFEDRVTHALRDTTGVLDAALAYDHPLEANWTQSYALEGEATDQDARQAHLRIVSPGYFDTVGVAVLSGRAFGEQDGLEAPGAVVVNQAFARAHQAEILGRSLRSSAAQGAWGSGAISSFQIVGVVEDELFRGLETPPSPAVYMSTRQFPQTDASIIVRTRGEPRPMLEMVRARMREAEARLTLGPSRTLSAILADQMAPRRVTVDVLGGLAGTALLLAALGIYGLLAVSVSGRRKEIGVRLALGASPAAVAAQIVKESATSAAVGLAFGMMLAAAAGRLVQGLLVGVGSGDPWTLAAASAVLMAVALGAALIPAVRAARINPVLALRAD